MEWDWARRADGAISERCSDDNIPTEPENAQSDHGTGEHGNCISGLVSPTTGRQSVTREQSVQRNSKDWLKCVRETGRWFDPHYWRSEDYLNSGPFSLDELNAVFVALQRLFPPKVTKSIFKDRRSYLCRLIQDFSIARHSEFVALGFELAIVQPWDERELLNRLRREDQHHGARFELEVWSGCIVAGIDIKFEPFRGSKHNADFLVGVGDGLVVDAKYSRKAEWTKEAERIAEKVSGIQDDEVLFSDVRKTVNFTPKMKDLLRTSSGVRLLREKEDELHQRVREAILLTPTEELPIAHEIDDLLEVQLEEYNGDGAIGSFDVATPDPQLEAERLIKNCVAKGASQIPADRMGAVVLDIGRDVADEVAVAEVTRWLTNKDEEGGLYPNMIGAILIASRLVTGCPTSLLFVMPVWKTNCPVRYRDERFWERFEFGLNWRRLRHWRWFEEKGTSGASNE